MGQDSIGVDNHAGRISFTWRSSRFSRSGALIRACSALVGPARRPWSRSACRTHLRSVSPEQPIFAAIEILRKASAYFAMAELDRRSKP